MLKLEIKLNDSKIIQENVHDLNAIYTALDKAFFSYKFRKELLSDGTLCYYGNGNSWDYGAFGSIITTLKDKEWFMTYVVKWIWYNSDDGENENDFSIEEANKILKRRLPKISFAYSS